MQTYKDQSPKEIRYGDTVTDADGRVFTAESDAVLVMGDYVVRAWWEGSEKDLILDVNSKVTISYDEANWSDTVIDERWI